MNDLGTLATKIVNYGFSDDTERFPVSYVSGWLDANIGEFNSLVNEEFEIDATGAIQLDGMTGSGLLPVEENIFATLYAVHYYEKSARDAIKGLIYGNSGDWFTLKEGDTTIQRPNKNSVAKSMNELGQSARSRLDDLVFNYNRYKAAPRQVYGTDGITPIDTINFDF